MSQIYCSSANCFGNRWDDNPITCGQFYGWSTWEDQVSQQSHKVYTVYHLKSKLCCAAQGKTICMYLPHPSAYAGFDTISIFKWILTGLNNSFKMKVKTLENQVALSNHSVAGP